jgi:class 3 adenylate cyclase
VSDLPRLRRENLRLSDEVKRLVKTERQLYEIQQHLDGQMRAYRQLYEISKKFNATLDLTTILQLAAQFVLYELNFERCLVLMRQAEATGFSVQAMDGYYDDAESHDVARLVLHVDSPALAPLYAGVERVLSRPDCDSGELRSLRRLFGMDEYVVLPLGGEPRNPAGLLVAGNTAERAHYQSRVQDGEAVLGLANLASQASTAINNASSYQALERERQSLEEKVRARTDEIAGWNRELEARVAAQLAELERTGKLRRFLAPQLAELIVAQGDESILESHRREIVVVFCDLRGFTAFAERAEPEEVMALLHDYHAAMGPIVAAFEGTLDHYAGDGIMVFFNDPLPCPDPAKRAIEMAVAMREAAQKLLQTWHRHGYDIGFGVGISQGYATLGQIVFAERMDYTAIGTVTNLAARLCGEAKDGQILIGRRVATAVEDTTTLDEIGDLSLKGLSQAVAVYNVVR